MIKLIAVVKRKFGGVLDLRPWLLPKLLSRGEKRVLSFLFGLFLVGFVWLLVSSWVSNGGGEPAPGGTLVEGVVASKTGDVEQDLARLINVGLPALANGMEISTDAQKYTFNLRPEIDANEIAQKIKNRPPFEEIEVSVDGGKIVFNLKQPLAPLLAQLSEPIFPYGPFKKAKSNKKEIILRRRENFFGSQPFLEQVIVRIYPNQKKLEQALRKGEIMAAGADSFSQTNKGFTVYKMALPRYRYLFFNLGKADLADREIRRKLKNNESLGKELNLTLLTGQQDEDIQEAQKIKADFEKLGVKITIVPHDSVILLKKDLPERNFDLLLYTIDYGPDPDPYPFWHSSQATAQGLNLSGFANAEADKLLEDGRISIDPKVRQEKYDKFYQILEDEVPALKLGQTIFQYQVSHLVKGIDLKEGAKPTDRFQNVTKWYIKSKRK